MNPLERRYRWLLLAYPRSYREERGDEVLGTLMDTARPDRQWPHPGDVADLIEHGLRVRSGLTTLAAPGRVLALAAVPGLFLAAAVSLVALVFGELPIWGPDPGLNPNQFGYGPFETTGVYAFGLVLAATASYFVGRVRVAQWLSLGVWVAVAGSCDLAFANIWGRPNITVLGLLSVCLVPVLVTQTSAVPRSGALKWSGAAFLAACLLLGFAAFAGTPTGHPNHWDPRSVVQMQRSGLIGRLHAWAPAAGFIVLVVAGVGAWRRGRRERWSAATLVLVPVTVVAYGGGPISQFHRSLGLWRMDRFANNVPLMEVSVMIGLVLTAQLAFSLPRRKSTGTPTDGGDRRSPRTSGGP